MQMADCSRVESAVEMLHKLKDAIRAVNKIPNCRVTSVRYRFEYNADACDPDWEQCKEVYAKIPFCRWLEEHEFEYTHLDDDTLIYFLED